MNARHRPARARHTRAFTLIEMVTSLIILSVIVVTCGSIIGMASNATGSSATRIAAQLQAADAASQIVDDLNVATHFTARTATATTFTVPDRLSVGSPQTVTYSWSGTAGDPLLRRFNGGTAATVLSSVKTLNFVYTTRTMGPAPGPGEQEIFSHDTAAGTLKHSDLKQTDWVSQYFFPSLPLGTTAYTLTRVRLRLKSGSPDAVMNVTIRLPDGSRRPTSTILAQTAVYMSALSTAYEWVDVPITGLGNQNAVQGLCIVLQYSSGNNSPATVQIDEAAGTVSSSAAWSISTNTGVSWSLPATSTCAYFAVFGTVP